MNKVWILIIIVSIIFGIYNDKISEMSEGLFNVPKETLNTLIKISSMLIVYSGIFQIALDANIINKLSKIIKKPIIKLFKLNDDVIDLICASIIANLLGLGPANMAIATNVIEKINNLEKYKLYNLSLYLLINVSSLCVLPMSTLALRETFKANINISFIYLLFIGSFITTIFAIILVKIFIKDDV